ncbi:MAG: FtsX-like permease family protein [Blastocatellia bacterium]|jgi:putative ABC transport system permease protein
MASLAWRNLFHDRVRLVVTLVGIVFSVVLTAVQFGLFLGFVRATSDLIDRSGADLWILSRGVVNLENGIPFTERKYHQALAVPGVADARRLTINFSTWKKPNGSDESILLAGVEVEGGMGVPWNLVAGRVEDLRQPDAVIIDELYREKLGVTELGQVFEIQGRRARVVGMTRGIRIFTTSPAVFTTVDRARTYFGMPADQTSYVLVRLAEGADPEKVRQGLLARLSFIEVLTTIEFGRKQAIYWMFETGAGVSVLIAALLGLVVGVVVVAQTIYASTIDHLREYGTLKAMGASNGYLYRVIIRQAMISGMIGYAIGITISLVVSETSLKTTTAIFLPWWLLLALFALTLLMCIGASMVSINKVTRLDPAMVFKG